MIQINYDNVDKIINKISNFLDDNRVKTGVISTFKNNALAAITTWTDRTGFKFRNLFNWADVSRSKYTDPINDYFDRWGFNQEKSRIAMGKLVTAANEAKKIVNSFDSSSLTDALESLKKVKDAMEKVKDLCEKFDETEVPNFNQMVSDERQKRYDKIVGSGQTIKGFAGIPDVQVPDKSMGKNPFFDAFNNATAAIPASRTYTPFQFGDYTNTGTTCSNGPTENQWYGRRNFNADLSNRNQNFWDAWDDLSREIADEVGHQVVENTNNSMNNGGNHDSGHDGSRYTGRPTDSRGIEVVQDDPNPGWKPTGGGSDRVKYDDPNKDNKPYTDTEIEQNNPRKSLDDYVPKPGKGGNKLSDGTSSKTDDSNDVSVIESTLDNNQGVSVAKFEPKKEAVDSTMKKGGDLLTNKDNSLSNAMPGIGTSGINNKSSLAGALGIVTGGAMPSIGVTPGAGTPGISLAPGMGINIPSISINGYNPYSINIGSGSVLNFPNADSASLYSNVNFSTTPALDTIQSPNQLLENLNSLPESVRRKIASMDLDNRAESAYYNSMSNEEFDEIKNKQITKFRSMSKEQIKERLKKQGYTDEEAEIIANNENIGVVAFLVGEQNVTMEALRRAITTDGVVLEEEKEKRPTIEELVSGEAAARLLNPYQDEEVRKAAEEYEYAKEKFNRAVSKSNASSKALKIANEKLRKTRLDIEQIDGTDINKWTKEHIVKYNDCVKIFMEEKETASEDLLATINAEKELQTAMEVLKEAKEKFNKKMAEATSIDPSLLLLVGKKEKEEKSEETNEEKEPFVMINKPKIMPDLQMHNLDNIEVLEETGSLSSTDKAVVEQNVSQSVETYQTEQPVVENKPAESIPKEETVGSMEINGKEIKITKPVNNFVEAPEK